MRLKSSAQSREEYLETLPEPRKCDIAAIDDLIRREAPDLEPHFMSGMLAYGSYQYRYESGREGLWFRIGLASNKAYISLYCCAADEFGYVAERYRLRLPKTNIGRSCVRFKRLADLDEAVLVELIRETARVSAVSPAL